MVPSFPSLSSSSLMSADTGSWGEREEQPSTVQNDQAARLWMATKLAPYSQLGFVRTPRSLGMISGDLEIKVEVEVEVEEELEVEVEVEIE